MSLGLAALVRRQPYLDRFTAALRWAGRLAPFLHVYYRLRGHWALGTPRERALASILLMLHFRGVRFPSDVEVDPSDLTGPAVVVCRHTQLNNLAVRAVAEAGAPVSVLASREVWERRVMGADLPLDVIAAEGRMRLRRVATALQQGRVVFAAIDNNVPDQGYLFRRSIPGGTWYFSDQVPRLAAAVHVPLWTCVVDWRQERVRVTLTQAPGDVSMDHIANALATDAITR